MRTYFEKERVEDMAISFEEQLSIVYPKGPRFHLAVTTGYDDKQYSEQSKEVSILRNSLQKTIDELPYPIDFNEFNISFAIAVRKWKTKNTQRGNNATSENGDMIMAQVLLISTGYTNDAAANAKPSSLLDQFQGGFALPISLEEIQEASSSQERLTLLKKINYLEDLQMDWNTIRPLLTNDLSELFLANPNLSLELINLHRAWFDQGRSSSEYTPLLYGICGNLLDTLAKIMRLEESQATQDANETSQSTVVTSLVQNWRDMWVDLMQRDQYSVDLAEKMEKCMFALFLRPGSFKMTRMAQKVLALIDPSATWFQSWENQILTNGHLVSLLRSSESDTKILPELWTQIRKFRDTDEINVENVPYQLYSIAILSIALCRTRLYQFPWDAFTKSNSREELENRMNNFRTVVDEMLDLFLQVVDFVSLDDESNDGSSNADLKITVLNGIEAILAGSHDDNDSEFDRRYRQVKSSLQEQNRATDKVFDRVLKIRLNQ